MKTKVVASFWLVLVMCASVHGGLWDWFRSASDPLDDLVEECEEEAKQCRVPELDLLVASVVLNRDTVRESFEHARDGLKVGEGRKWQVPTCRNHGEPYSKTNKPFSKNKVVQFLQSKSSLKLDSCKDLKKLIGSMHQQEIVDIVDVMQNLLADSTCTAKQYAKIMNSCVRLSGADISIIEKEKRFIRGCKKNHLRKLKQGSTFIDNNGKVRNTYIRALQKNMNSKS